MSMEEPLRVLSQGTGSPLVYTESCTYQATSMKDVLYLTHVSSKNYYRCSLETTQSCGFYLLQTTQCLAKKSTKSQKRVVVKEMRNKGEAIVDLGDSDRASPGWARE